MSWYLGALLAVVKICQFGVCKSSFTAGAKTISADISKVNSFLLNSIVAPFIVLFLMFHVLQNETERLLEISLNMQYFSQFVQDCCHLALMQST